MARLDRLIDTVGDGTGLTEMAAIARDYFVRPGPNELVHVGRLLMVMEDNAKFAGEKYTAAGALTNGIVITLENPAGVIHNFTPQPIKKIGHWALLAGVDVVVTDFTTGNDLYMVRWTMDKAENHVILDGRKGEFFKVAVRDTIATAVSHLIQVQGDVQWVG
jgi:hypothetical protein